MIDIGTKVRRNVNGLTGKCIGRPYAADNGTAIMVRWDNGRTFPVYVKAITAL